MCEFEAHNKDVTYWELFSPKLINRTHIGMWMQIWSQLTGMNVMMYYIAYIFTMVCLLSRLSFRHNADLPYRLATGVTLRFSPPRFSTLSMSS